MWSFDWCSQKDTVAGMTTPDQMRRNVLKVLQLLVSRIISPMNTAWLVIFSVMSVCVSVCALMFWKPWPRNLCLVYRCNFWTSVSWSHVKVGHWVKVIFEFVCLFTPGHVWQLCCWGRHQQDRAVVSHVIITRWYCCTIDGLSVMRQYARSLLYRSWIWDILSAFNSRLTYQYTQITLYAGIASVPNESIM